MIRSIVCIAVLVVLSSAPCDSHAVESVDRPNIVFIVADDLGYGHLGCYGQEKIETPHVDRMASQGTRFTQFYAGHCVCSPSRSTLMTGYHTGHTSARINGGYRLAEEFFHGNGGLRGGKGDFYEGGLRVPLVVRWPGRVAAGGTDDLIWAFWDVMPTLAELARAECPAGIDGVSFAARLLGRPRQIPDRCLYWERQPQNKGGRPPWSVAVRRGKWKAVRNKPHLPIELFDLSCDVGEQHDVAKENADVVEQIREYLQTARTVSREYPAEEPSWSYSPVDTGYVR